MDGQTDRWRDEQKRFYRTPSPKDGGSIMFFGSLRINFPSIIWLDCESYGKNKCKKKGYNQHSSGFKKFKNNDPQQIDVE